MLWVLIARRNKHVLLVTKIGSDLVCPSGTRCGRPKEKSEHAHLKVGASHNLQIPTRGALHAYII